MSFGARDPGHGMYFVQHQRVELFPGREFDYCVDIPSPPAGVRHFHAGQRSVMAASTQPRRSPVLKLRFHQPAVEATDDQSDHQARDECVGNFELEHFGRNA